jgi:integrase
VAEEVRAPVSEALALTWGDVGEQTILVEKALAFGTAKETKNRRMRSVELLAPLAADLRGWRMASGRPPAEALVFPRHRVGGPWNDDAYRAWRRKVFAEAVKGAGPPAMRPYDLRHSFASLLFAEGRSVIEVAQQLGHAPSMSLDVYGHVLAEVAGQPRRPASELIAEARKNVRVKFARAAAG